MRSPANQCGCFPTGRHYPGIADLIASAIQSVEGLCEEFPPGTEWARIPLAVIDFETTGTDPNADRVLEIGVVCFDGTQVSRREALLVNPGIAVPEEARAVHGISEEELRGAPAFDQVLPELLKLIDGRLPVAYNASFDRSFLSKEIERANGLPESTNPAPAVREQVVWIDPLVWAREILKELKSRKLAEVAAHLGVPLERAHRAAGDAEATGRVLLGLAPHMPRIYGELIRLQQRYAAFQEAEFAAWKRFK